MPTELIIKRTFRRRALSQDIEVLAGSELKRGVITAMRTFENRMNFHLHLRLLVTECGVSKAGLFHKLPQI